MNKIDRADPDEIVEHLATAAVELGDFDAFVPSLGAHRRRRAALVAELEAGCPRARSTTPRASSPTSPRPFLAAEPVREKLLGSPATSCRTPSRVGGGDRTRGRRRRRRRRRTEARSCGCGPSSGSSATRRRASSSGGAARSSRRPAPPPARSSRRCSVPRLPRRREGRARLAAPPTPSTASATETAGPLAGPSCCSRRRPGIGCRRPGPGCEHEAPAEVPGPVGLARFEPPHGARKAM